MALIGERGMVAIQVGLGRSAWGAGCACWDARRRRRRTRRSPVTVDPGDWSWMTLQARVDAARGDHEAAELIAVEGIHRGLQTDQPTWHGDAWRDLAEVRLAAGRDGDAADAFEQALCGLLRKRNLAMAAQVPSKPGVRARAMSSRAQSGHHP